MTDNYSYPAYKKFQKIVNGHKFQRGRHSCETAVKKKKEWQKINDKTRKIFLLGFHYS